MWLFRFPTVAIVLYFVCKTEFISSLVVVFPLLPVNAIIGMFKYSL